MAQTMPSSGHIPTEDNAFSEKQESALPNTTNVAQEAINSTTTSSSSHPRSNLRTAENESGNTKTVPFASPAPNCNPVNRPALTNDQQTKYDDLLSHVSTIQSLPLSIEKNAATEPLADNERMWLTKECLLRYLRASKWILPDAKKRIEATLVWRREYGVEKITADHVEIENRTGKLCIQGFDIHSRPILHMNPGRQNTETSERQVQETVWFLERVIDMAPAGQDTTALLIDYKSSSSAKNPSLKQGKQVLNILQNHYPERLGRALIMNVPWFVWGFYKLITPFIDPVTKEKLKFNEDLKTHIPQSQLLKEYGGDMSFEYNHEAYWPALVALAEERRRSREARWRQNGAKIGESEDYLKMLDDDVGKADLRHENGGAAATANAVDDVTEGISSVTVA